MSKKINWSVILEWAILIVVVVGLIIGGIEYIKHVSTFVALTTILVFIAGGVLGAIFMKWYAKYVKDLPW